MSFLQALDRELYGIPIDGKLTVAQYLLYSTAGSGLFGLEQRPVWVIHLHGLPTFGSATHMRHVMDIETGRHIIDINLPDADYDNPKGTRESVQEE